MGQDYHSDQRGMTPVIGVVLILALTILLVGTAGAFFFGFTESAKQTQKPTTTFSFEYNANPSGADSLEISHQVGDPVNLHQMYVDVEDATCSGGSGNPNSALESRSVHDAWNYGAAVDEMKAGFTVTLSDSEVAPTLCSSGSLELSSATVTIIWRSPSGESFVLDSWTG